MKILHLSKYYHPFRGGIEKFIKELSEGSVSQGHEVLVLCASESFSRKEENLDGVKVVRLPRWGVLYSQPLTPHLLWEIKKHIAWADVVHLHTPNPLTELVFALGAPSKPTIVTYHCDVVRQRKLMKVYSPVAQRVLQASDNVIVSTPNHLQYSLPLQNHKGKTKVIPFGTFDVGEEKNMDRQQRVQKIKSRYEDYFLFIGRLVPYKGVDVLLKAMTQVKKNLVCIGEGPRWEAWHKLAKDLGVQDKVHFLGKVTDDRDFAAYIYGCQSLVLPSVDESEAFGIVLIEAMARGKPVITTKLKSGVSWVNQAGVTGLQVEPRDWMGLAKALSQMAENHSMRTQMGEAARARYQENFRVEDMVLRYEDIYFQVSGKSKKVAA